MIQSGSKVKIHYTLKVEEQVVESSAGRDPLSYVHGEGQIIRGLEEELEGLGPGDRKQVTVTPEKGYGPRDPGAVKRVPKDAFTNAEELTVGDVVTGEAGGTRFRAQIAEVANDEIALDLNHPLAGKTLDFEVEVVAVQ